jgi:NAD dependent epimerase/dehydratase family enzyme
MGFGGKVGTGKQWISWIGLDDLLGIISYSINNESIKGPFVKQNLSIKQQYRCHLLGQSVLNRRAQL